MLLDEPDLIHEQRILCQLGLSQEDTTDTERWTHIETRHPNLQEWKSRVLETIEAPEFAVPGTHGELLAVRTYPHLGKTRFLVVVYRETGQDGFIITAVLTSDVRNLKKRGVLWPKL